MSGGEQFIISIMIFLFFWGLQWLGILVIRGLRYLFYQGDVYKPWKKTKTTRTIYWVILGSNAFIALYSVFTAPMIGLYW